MPHDLVFGAREWIWAAGGCALVTFALLIWGYRRAPSSMSTRVLAGTLKAIGVAVLAICLLEPLFSGQRVRPGANSFVILADNSQSMTLRDKDAEQTRGEELQSLLDEQSPWSVRLREDFEVRRYAYDSQLRAVPDFQALGFDGGSSSLAASLSRLARRYQGRPLAGILLFTDGNATDAELLDQIARARDASASKDTFGLPPVYPVLIGNDKPAGDVGLDRIALTQTSFEDAPVALTAQVHAAGYAGRTLAVEVLDDQGELVEEQKIVVPEADEPQVVRFQLRPRQAGVSFYQVRVAAEDEREQFDDAANTVEATLANNSRLVCVDRGQGPYEVLYISGRPNWEYKFLRRALDEDDQVRLVGLVRIAKREPKFTFRGRGDEEVNPLFRGFEAKDKEQLEQHDQPVLVRLGIEEGNEDELRDGFPKAAEDLYRYHAIVLDDIESEFFSQDQMLLIKDFVRQRGGGLLMLGGQESFKNGKFDRTPIGDLLPVYLDELPPAVADARYQLSLTKEGMLEPWVRLRAEENAEQVRLHAMPRFHTLSRVRGIKPGATMLASAAADGGGAMPAVVEQRFGRGRTGALLLGDLWRWSLRRAAKDEEDLEKAWRQTIRWLVADVPKRVELNVERDGKEDVLGAPVTLAVEARDQEYKPLDNASVTVRVTPRGGKPLEITAEASPRKAGVYTATFIPRQAGGFHVQAVVKASDGSDIGEAGAGFTSEPAADEFRELGVNRELLESIAAQTGGEVVPAGRIDRFVAELPTRAAAITEPYVEPLWHRPGVFLLAIACLVAEWGLRRWKGLP